MTLVLRMTLERSEHGVTARPGAFDMNEHRLNRVDKNMYKRISVVVVFDSIYKEVFHRKKISVPLD